MNIVKEGTKELRRKRFDEKKMQSEYQDIQRKIMDGGMQYRSKKDSNNF